jgi:hypothetical protein
VSKLQAQQDQQQGVKQQCISASPPPGPPRKKRHTNNQLQRAAGLGPGPRQRLLWHKIRARQQQSTKQVSCEYRPALSCMQHKPNRGASTAVGSVVLQTGVAEAVGRPGQAAMSMRKPVLATPSASTHRLSALVVYREQRRRCRGCSKRHSLHTHTQPASKVAPRTSIADCAHKAPYTPKKLQATHPQNSCTRHHKFATYTLQHHGTLRHAHTAEQRALVNIHARVPVQSHQLSKVSLPNSPPQPIPVLSVRKHGHLAIHTAHRSTSCCTHGAPMSAEDMQHHPHLTCSNALDGAWKQDTQIRWEQGGCKHKRCWCTRCQTRVMRHGRNRGRSSSNP